MTDKVKQFVEEIGARMTLGKVPNSEIFKFGQSLGLKCREIVDLKKEHFAFATRGASKPVLAAKAPTAKKAPKVKKVAAPTADEGVELTPKQKKALKNADESTGVVQSDETAFVWIASPEEIASTEEVHTVDY